MQSVAGGEPWAEGRTHARASPVPAVDAGTWVIAAAVIASVHISKAVYDDAATDQWAVRVRASVGPLRVLPPLPPCDVQDRWNSRRCVCVRVCVKP